MTSIKDHNDDSYKNYEKVVLIYNAIKRYVKKPVIENLLQLEGDINYEIFDGSKRVPNLLHIASRFSRDHELLDLLLIYGADYTCKNDEGKTVVHTRIQEAIDYRELQCETTFEDKFINAILNAQLRFNDCSNPCDPNGISHFHAACMTNNVQTVQFFLENGVDVDEAVKEDSPFFALDTPLHLAVKYTCPDVLEVLLVYGANFSLKNADNMSPLHLIVKKMTEECQFKVSPAVVKISTTLIGFIIDSDIDIDDAMDDFGFSKLHLACLLEDEFLVDDFSYQATDIDQAVNFYSPVCPGFTALHFAALSNVQIFNLMLMNGADINVENEDGQTPFDLCLQNYTAKDVHSILVSIGEWRNIVLSDGKTKLIDVVSAMGTSKKFIKFMKVTNSASTIHVPLDSSLLPGYTLLHLAVIFTKEARYLKRGNPQRLYNTTIIDECMKNGADVTVPDAEGSTALHLAFYMGKRCVVDYLLDHHCTKGVENVVDNNNLSHFHIACAASHRKAVEHFLTIGVDLDNPLLTNFKWREFCPLYHSYKHFFICSGSTGLHINVAGGSVFITKQLLQHETDFNVRDAYGFTPIHRLLSSKNYGANEIADLLFSKVEHLRDVTADCGLSHLHVACYFGRYEAIEKLLEIGADAKAAVVYRSDKKIKDEVLLDPYGNYYEPLSFLAKYSGYTALDFLWHSKNVKCDSNEFWKISFMLIKRQANAFAKNCEGISRFQIFLKKVKDEQSNLPYKMLKKGIISQIRLEEEFGITKLHLACCLVDVKVVKDLVASGANANAKVNSSSPVWQGFTPLHFAVKRAIENYKNKRFLNKMKRIIRLLTEHGADPLLADDDNETPLHMINRLNTDEHNKLLKMYSFISKLYESIKCFCNNPRNNQELSVFHIACITGNVAIVEKFLEHGVDFNQATSYFSDYCPGSTPLHLILKYYQQLNECSETFSDEDVLQVIDLLIENGANVNAADAFGESLLFEVVKSKKSRIVLIEKLIRNGAEVCAMNVLGKTPFELLLTENDSTWEEIELFLKADCNLSAHNPITQEGYLAKLFRFNRGTVLPTDAINNYEIFREVINHIKITEIDKAGRTPMHNVVSVDATIDVGFPNYINRIIRRRTTMLTREKFYGELIRELLIQGCDIDRQDNRGRTALHLAVSFNNVRGILELLNQGADINIVDKNGETAFAYCQAIKYKPKYVTEVFATHIRKLQICKLYVNEQNKQLQVVALKQYPFSNSVFDFFDKEIKKAKRIKINNIFRSINDFLMNRDVNLIYMKMTKEERHEVDTFFENIDNCNFVEIDCLLKLKYRQTIERIKLLQPGLASLSALTKYRLPDLCCRTVLKFLKNHDLKSLIAAVAQEAVRKSHCRTSTQLQLVVNKR